MTNTDLQILKGDLETHRAAREQMKSGKGVSYLKHPASLVPSYDKIICSIEEEIVAEEKRRAVIAKKKAAAKKSSKKTARSKKSVKN